MIKVISRAAMADWVDLRYRLWPDCSIGEHRAEADTQLSAPERYQQWLSVDDTGAPTGLLEVSIRTDHVNGTQSTPVGFIEGIYVMPAARHQGVAKRMIALAEQWFVQQRCVEMASDVDIRNQLSQSVHLALGFEETQRVVYYRKRLEA